MIRTGPKTVSAHGPARLRVLTALKGLGPMTADALAADLKVTTMAVRLHLQALEADGLITHQEQSRSRGRPARLWSVTAAADPYFTDAHAALTADLLSGMKATFGEKGLDRILAERTRAQLNHYGKRVGTKRSLRRRLEALAAIRTEEGYMAEVKADGEGGWLLLENHCPVCAAARLCTGLCREELNLFRQVLGAEVDIQRTDHIVAGARRCVYRVAEK